MTRFERVKTILDQAVGGANFAAHGPFWRNLNRDQFVAKSVYGKQLVVLNDGANSNIIHALRGQPPFGQDTGNPTAPFRRMPAGRPAVGNLEIGFIEQWINDGCPEDLFVEDLFETVTAGPFDPQEHNDFWRAFDDWAMFQATPEVRQAINDFFTAAEAWMGAVLNPGAGAAWQTALAVPEAQNAIALLAQKQEQTVREFHRAPVQLLKLLEGFELFGAGTLPIDPLRPQDPNHNMNGPIMWFFWAACAEACGLMAIAPPFWRMMQRAILQGLLNDGLFRGRFNVVGFAPDAAGQAAVRVHVTTLPDAALNGELRQRFADTGFQP